MTQTIDTTVDVGVEVAQLACFEVHGGIFAIDVHRVRQIVRWQEITPLPNGPALIEGVVDLGGAIVPVVDLGRALGGPPVSKSSAACIAVVEVDGLVFGLRVAAAIDVLSVAPAALEAAPALARKAGYQDVRAVVRRGDAPPVMVLSLERLLEGVSRSARARDQAPS